MKSIALLFLTLAIPCFIVAQEATQTISGQIIDQESEVPLMGVSIFVPTADSIDTYTDENGNFSIEDVLIGRHTIIIEMMGFEPKVIDNVILNSGKQLVLEITLTESITEMEQLVVTYERDKTTTINDMTTVSSRTFDLEEVTRYAGATNDISRMASNFAGVSGTDDARNDIVIRGNSPTGLLWQLEGIPIPNPNHFGTTGTSGGPVSAMNPNLLKSSDFLTSAFPAEYGNATSGVFDLYLRNGNRNKHEFTAQLNAFSGLEAMAEGPLKKGHSSYLISYRYSFVQLAQALNFPIGTNSIPKYQDLTFNLDFGTSKIGRFKLFGLGGKSQIDFLAKDVDEDDIFAQDDENSYAKNYFGALGLSHKVYVTDNSYLKTVISANSDGTNFKQDRYATLGDESTVYNVSNFDDHINRYIASSVFNHKMNAKNTLRVGGSIQHQFFDTNVRDRSEQDDLDGDGIGEWLTMRDFAGGLNLLQFYAQHKYRPTEKWTINAGLHSQYLDFTNDFAIAPRVGAKWSFLPNQSLNFGYGMHHQVTPLPILFNRQRVDDNTSIPTNESLSFTRSNHIVVGYDRSYGNDWRSKVEVYYQHLDQVPVEDTASTFTALNDGADFGFSNVNNLVNEGTGYNIGLELTLEKFFSKGYYGLMTLSVFDSKSKTKDNIWRSTAFNNNIVWNLLGGKEWKVGKAQLNAITWDFKVSTSGGRFYTPIDLDASIAANSSELDDSQAYEERYDPYFRIDTKIGYRKNNANKKISQTFYIDFQNLTNQENILTQNYNKDKQQIDDVYQRGFFPDLLWRVEF